MHHYLNNQRLAEKILRYAAKLDPWSSETWYVFQVFLKTELSLFV